MAGLHDARLWWRMACALAAVLVLLVVFRAVNCGKEGMQVSPEAMSVAAKSKAVFDKFRGNPPYSEFARRIKRDPVLFDHVRSLHRQGGISPPAVQRGL